MLNAQIIEQLKKLNLNMFMQELEEQEKNNGYKDFSFSDRLSLLLQREILERENKNKTSLYYVIVVSSSSSMAARYQTCNCNNDHYESQHHQRNRRKPNCLWCESNKRTRSIYTYTALALIVISCEATYG